ncbi:DNA-deoxyinosine glycosylase [Limnohabitans sp. JirII-29]|uniref:DNA-deoxyinosine glycosylase n=1 Tax=unclassified Limnohabitans TaxID=2626134 RepID=UPI000C1F3084|nr:MULTISPECIES: DNA-deoxyinosine glycosylase [unclassified Limnohabitans]PIT79238.1 DNA-deoxyinosine glycosylase [Limnohabitans sp. JirII-31]PUE25376.1 DNA-deoxyinosine glycosylase [Limnohabitans sp. JirII-29]
MTRHPTPQPTLQGLPPLLSANTRLVVLGSFPGVASLRAQQYYGHPQNHFWKIVATLLSPDPAAVLAQHYDARAQWLLAHGVGLWDVYAACEREGSLDSQIQNAQVNDLPSLRQRCPALAGVAHNGGESFRHARITQALGLPVYRLPSTSPANASWSFTCKLAAWCEVFEAVGLIKPGA